MSEDEVQPDPAPSSGVDAPPAYQPDHQLIVPSVKESGPTEPRSVPAQSRRDDA